MLRYGENPHQRAALYVNNHTPNPGLAQAEQLHGKEMSYNNYVDADAARRAAYDHTEPAVAIIKHANPCGIAVGTDIAEAHRQARTTATRSRRSAASSRPTVRSPPRWPSRSPRSSPRSSSLRRSTTTRSRSCARSRACGCSSRATSRLTAASRSARSAAASCCSRSTRSTRRATTRRPGPSRAASRPTRRRCADLAFAWRAVRSVKSNAILLAKDGATVGVGMGQVNRVDSCRLAVARAGEDRARGSVAASDAFFPFPDGPRCCSTPA